MFMYGVQYHRAQSVADAASLLASNPNSKILAGGQTLIAAMKLRLSAPSALIDLGGLSELNSIRIGANTVTLGAMVRHTQVAQSSEIRAAIPSLPSLAKGIGDNMVRNMGTIGGSIANNDPAADYPAAFLALAGVAMTNERSIPAEEFFVAMYETALRPTELLTSLTFRIPSRSTYMKFKNPASRFATVGVYMAQFDFGVRVAVTGAGPSVFRVTAMEEALDKKFAPSSLDGIQVPLAELSSDLHAQADYRAHLIGVLARRAVEQLAEPT
jgi:carbon-monoxide dehydrogenase medium subunit